MGGDFLQVLPVISRSTRGQTVDACLSRSHLWENVHVLHLKKNMRAADDASYSEFLIRVGDGDEPCVGNEMIMVPEEMVIPWVSDASLSQLIDVTFPNLVENVRDRDYMVNRALITPLNEYVEKLNDQVLRIFPGKEVLFYSFDSVDDDTHGIYQQPEQHCSWGFAITHFKIEYQCAYYVVAEC
ncbi:uncharacterized protein LOC113351179 [Papaver somniferum]|uniref:uncharacterized protein LOC113351179 n=1 Tax=Papaver somniferum TaxID=3469 RepID=UPI000E6FBE83|nr:uncharacterized protein LOC113351179 [Papaver somniferum]